MPGSPFEKMLIPESLDRRRKLTAAQKSEIAQRYKDGGCSLNSLAREYGVSKKSILIIVNPDAKKRNDNYIKDHWREYAFSTEENTRYKRKFRANKRRLFEQGLLIKNTVSV